MIHIRIGGTGQQMVQCSGDVKKIIFELVTAIVSIYQTLRRANPAEAAAYRYTVGKVLREDNGAWDEPVEGIGFCVPTESGDA